MNSLKTGKLIAKLRKDAGYTQKSLACALYVTDKAVSKWERGLSTPDTSLLPKLSMLLDADVEHLINGKMPYGISKDWSGVLVANDIEYILYNKPVLYYLLSYYLLVGITDIEIQTNNKTYIESLNLKQYNINVYYEHKESKKKMIIYDKMLLFGVNLTRQFQDAISNNENIRLSLNNEELPIVFIKDCKNDYINEKNKYKLKKLGRGTIKIPLITKDNIKDASDFVRIYEQNNKEKIADLSEICMRRGLL